MTEPKVSPPPKKRRYAQWGGVALGLVLIVCSVGDSHVSLGVFFFGLSILIGAACYDRLGVGAFASLDPNRDMRSMRRAAKRSADRVLGNQESREVPPEEFLRGLGERKEP